jgi:hypothetical protein
MELYNYLKSKTVKELQDLYVYSNDYQKSIIKKCIEDKTILNKNEYFNNTTNKFYDNINKFEEIMKTDDSNNKFQDRLNINLKNKEKNNNENLGKRKNF